MSSAFETTTDTTANAELVTDPLPATASRKRAWIWALILCGSAVAATAHFYPHTPETPNVVTVEAVKPVPTQALIVPPILTMLPGGTVEIVPGDTEWRVLLVPEHGVTSTIYSGDSTNAERIYKSINAMQHRATSTGKPQKFAVLNNGRITFLNEPIEN